MSDQYEKAYEEAIEVVATYQDLLKQAKQTISAVGDTVRDMRRACMMQVIASHATNPLMAEANEHLMAAVHKIREAQAHLVLGALALDRVVETAREGSGLESCNHTPTTSN